MPLSSQTKRYALFATIAAMLCALNFSNAVFDALSLQRSNVGDGQWWRLLTGNFVHFGWLHTLMNAAAFLLSAVVLLCDLSRLRFLVLLASCCLAVGAGIYGLNPEYSTYAGLSGAIHGLIIAGLYYTQRHPLWARLTALLLVIGKIIQEHSANFQANDLQALLPVPVAVDAHLYGAIAGAAFVLLDIALQRLRSFIR